MKYNLYKSRPLTSVVSVGLLLLLALTFFSCDKEDAKTSFSVSGDSLSLSVGPEARTDNYSISTAGSWEIVPVEPMEWANVSPMEGKGSADFTLTIDENKTPDMRTAKFAFRVDGRFRSEIISVDQEGIAPAGDGDEDVDLYLNVEGITDNAIAIDTAAFEETYFVRSNGPWTINWDETVDWISVSPTEGIGDASVTISVDANTTTEQRSVDLNFVREDGVTLTVKLNQAEVVE